MALALYLAFLGAACAYALLDWRRAWFLVPLCGILQDPIRKLTPNNPVAVSFLVVILYTVILFAGRRELIRDLGDFSARFPRVHAALFAVLLLLMVAALNGLATYGIENWKVPLLSLITYCIPVVAVLMGYTWLRREEVLLRFLNVYVVLTSVALIGTVLEYMRVPWRILGLVSMEGEWIRHLPGIQIRLLSGVYRGPDIMAWHAATLTAIAIALAIREGFGRRVLIWGGIAAWGFFNCIIAGRRKAIYYVIVFMAMFLWRYFRRIRAAQIFALLGVLVILAGVVHHFNETEESSVYTRGALTTQGEVSQRLQGGVFETFDQFGLMGAGLGTATQGVYHLLGR